MRSILEQSIQSAAPEHLPDSPAPQTVTGRLASLDVFRGFVMMALSLQGYFPGLASGFPNNPVLHELGRQFDHVAWQGGVFWDLIQPSFMFMVGVAMTYSYHSRRARGESAAKITAHVLYRSLVLIALGVMLASAHSDRTVWMFGEILCQIGLAYPFAYLLVGRSARTQWIAVGAILLVTWLAFFLWPTPGPGFDYAAIGAPPVPEPYTGLYAHWNRYTNFAYAFDRWFLNRFPRSDVFLANFNYGATLNFFPSIVTLTFGVMAAELLRSPRTPREKLRTLVVAGAISLVVGLGLGHTVCPIIKALWTPSYVFASTAWVCWFLAAAYWLADMRGLSRPLFPLTVVGRNSLAMYLMLRLLKEPVRATVEIHAGPLRQIDHYWTFEFAAVVLILWLICYWLYRRKIFLSI